MAMLIKANGECRQFDTLELEPLQKAVGGYIEIMTSPDEAWVMIMNDEGRMMQLPPNFKASDIAGRMIVGDVIVCDASEWSKGGAGV
jgi:hypothetical protein